MRGKLRGQAGYLTKLLLIPMILITTSCGNEIGLSLSDIVDTVKRGGLGDIVYVSKEDQRLSIKYKDINPSSVKGVNLKRNGNLATARVRLELAGSGVERLCEYNLVLVNTKQWYFRDYGKYLNE